jgi:hypothetical protein
VFAQDPKQALVILATPTFSKWLEDESFIADFLRKVARTIPRSKKSRNKEKTKIKYKTFEPLEIDVVCACVDGISPHVDWFPHAIRRSVRQGFSVLQGRTSEILPNLWDTEDSTTTSSPTMTASLTFAKGRTSRNSSHVVLPLANTLFSNGRHSTLLVSKWRVENDSFVRVRAEEKRNQIINVFDGRSLGTPSIHVPAIPLTPARRIISGLGNIVRQIDFGNEDAGPASRELEGHIDEYLLQTRREKATVAVWALIIPKDSMPQQKPEPPYGLLYEPDPVKSQWQETLPNPNFIGHWINRGARFCRVLSGGGGWGVKQGLLSLDPQSTYSEISEARFDFSTGSMEEQQASALGNIAEPDAYIQFFILDNKNARGRPLRSPKPASVDIWQMTTVVGTIPSTIDDQRFDSLGPQKARDAKVICQAGHFGALSEAGMFLSAPSIEQRAPKGRDGVIKKPAILSKIDLPYSYIYRDFRLEAKPGRFKPSKSSAQAGKETELTFRTQSHTNLSPTKGLFSKEGGFRTSQKLALTFRKVPIDPPKEPAALIQEPEEETYPPMPIDSHRVPTQSIQEPRNPTFQIRTPLAFLDAKNMPDEPTFRIKSYWSYSDPRKEPAQPAQDMKPTFRHVPVGPPKEPAPPGQELEQPTFRTTKHFVNSNPVVSAAKARKRPYWRIRKIRKDFDAVSEPMADSPVITKYYLHASYIRKTNKFPAPEADPGAYHMEKGQS